MSEIKDIQALVRDERLKDPIIHSILDDDQYKFSQQMFFLELFPNEQATYRFKNRGKHRFTPEFLEVLQYHINSNFPWLRITEEEIEWFKGAAPYLKPWYFEYLRGFRYKPEQVTCWLDSDNNLGLEINGPIVEAMMWEVKLMALISELYFKMVDTNWTMNGQITFAQNKAKQLADAGCIFTDFGTRRRRNLATQEIVVRYMDKYHGFVGTSNVHLSMVNELIPKGTIAHEAPMAMQALEGIRNCNYYAMHNWVRVYNGSLGTALPDTLGSKQFLKNFNVRFAKLFDGVRHDSGCPYWFTDLFVAHYKKLGIDPMTKTIIFSNALDCDRAVKINEYCKGKIRCAFGIGTFFTNLFENSPALNMVIKMHSVNGIPVVKISDDEGKVMGDPDAIRVTKWECNGTPLDYTYSAAEGLRQIKALQLEIQHG